MNINERYYKNYSKGVPFDIDIPNVTLPYVLDQTTHFYPNKIATDFLGKQITYKQLNIQVGKAATVLRSAGIRRGDHISIILPNCPQHIIALYAALRLGAVVVEHNPLAPTSEIQSQLKRCNSKLIIAWEKSVEKILSGFNTN